MHIHVLGSHGEAKFWIEPAVTLADYTGFSKQEVKELAKSLLKSARLRQKTLIFEHRSGAYVVVCEQRSTENQRFLASIVKTLNRLLRWLKNMLKKLNMLGKNISQTAKIQNISNQGIWILVHEQEFFMPFSKFPWFLKATIEQIYRLELFHKNHLYWPELDIDLDLESIKNPQAYPLIAISFSE